MTEQRYLVDEFEVCIVDEPSKAVRQPTASERLILDRYFAGPDARDARGRAYMLAGEELEGINGLVVTYRVSQPT